MGEKKRLSFGLVGYPLGHSISPQIHKRLFELSGIDATYRLIEIEPEKFGENERLFKSLDGFNVTIPHKRRILPLLSHADPRAQRCGAVNTVKCEDGRLCGYNTDALGFIKALCDAGIALRGRVLLCGAGGTARMMACEALERGCSLVVASRNEQKADLLRSDLLRLFPFSDISAQSLFCDKGAFDLILNATPVGMYPNIEGCPVGEHIIANSAAVFDAVYNPCNTVLIKKASAAGANAVCGISMLVFQAAAAQSIWTGARFAPKDIGAVRSDMEKLLKTRFGGQEDAP